MQTKIYAAYGSNMNLEQMSVRCPNAKVIGTGTLKDYHLTFRGRYKGVANIEPCKGKEVPVVLWEITGDCESALDMYEGYPRLYEKKEIKVKMKDKMKKAMAYIMTDDYTNMPAKPTEYYYQVIATGYVDNELDIKPLEVALSECLNEVEEQNG
ncbi:MAG: gamma-glutamylcyclotransferase [Cellulosilyticum sp.]|nr:gamma-glutamylcyclotransferase [Cellulosilyticum sp.]